VRPFQLIRDLYWATVSLQPLERPDASEECPARFGFWWVCFLLGNILSNIAAQIAWNDPDAARLRTSLIVDLVAEVISIAAAVSFIGVLRSITSNLWRRANA
jgi:hypothetical protein